MRAAFLAALLPLAAHAAPPDDCVPDAQRIAHVAETCASARPLDCIQDLVLALRTGSPAQATAAAELLLDQRAVTLALGWALASPKVAEATATKVSAALKTACDGGDRAACTVRSEALSTRAGKPVVLAAAAGELAPAEVSKIVRRYLPLAERCYTRHLACAATAAGTVRLALRVDPSGAVVGLELESGLSADVDACVASTVSRWRFPAPAGGEARVRFPLVFANGG